ncbi:MAG: 3'-5' exonuclease [Propionibacteriaceae bacterium]|nr:3'-5' exonuclease [Propionibacteriaceae bacterium]
MGATLIMAKQANQIDGNLKKKAFTFLEKLTTDPTAPGLHIEPIVGSVDPRVRTGRVDQQYRAVLFQLSAGEDMAFVFHGIWNHDDAIDVAKHVTLNINSINGMAEIRTVSTDEAPLAEEAPAPHPAEPAPEPAVASPRPAAPEVTAQEPEVVVGATWDELVNVLGLPRAVADAAVMAKTERALLAAAEGGPEWQQHALLSLATGSTVADVLQELHIEVDTPPSENPSDEEILARLKHPSAGIEFAEIDGVDELRRIIDGGDFGAWRVFLHPEQKEFALRPRNGAFRLSGGAGTGKTVVLLHRAQHLLREDPAARVLLTTFTTTLAAAMRRDLARLNPSLPITDKVGAPGAVVAGIDAIAREVVATAGADLLPAVADVLGTGREDITPRKKDDRWAVVAANADPTLPEGVRSKHFLQSEYELVVLPNRIVDADRYLRVSRPGRHVRLSRAQRAAVWESFAEYRRLGQQRSTADFQEVTMIAATVLQRRAARYGYLADHVLIDEGQDMTPARWHLIRSLVGEGANDLFIAEDSHQRIYGNKITLSHYGINIRGRSRRLTLNYRTTAENLRLAVAILDGGDYRDLEAGQESTKGYRSARRGPVPELTRCSSTGEELDHAADLLRRWLADAAQPESLAVLVRDNLQASLVASGLSERGVDTFVVGQGEPQTGTPLVMTMHRAKGMEFTKVLLFDISQGSVPMNLRDFSYDEADLADALLRERSLLYVAASRARDELAVSWHGKRSELLPTR